MIKLELLQMEHSILYSVEKLSETMLTASKFHKSYPDYWRIQMKSLRNKFNT